MILVVDDNDGIREMQAAVLQSADYAVRTAADGSQALQLIEQQCPQLVLLDITMPGMTGYQVLDQLRARHGDSLPVILVSALPEDEERNHAIARGATDYISKPFDIASVLGCVRRYLPGTAA